MIVINQSTEIRLLEMMELIKDDCADYYAITFNLSKLDPKNSSSFQMKIAVNVMNDFFRSYSGKIFVFKNHDIVLVVKLYDKSIIEKIIFQVRYLFIDDKLAFEAEGVVNNKFSSVHTLLFQWKDFFALCKQRMSTDGSAVRGWENKESEIEKSMIDAVGLAKVEKELEPMDLSHLVRTQKICAYVNNTVKPIFSELFVSIASLKDSLKYNIKFSSHPLLFRYLTEKLDQKVLEVLQTHPGSFFDQPLSLNMNISTILSDQFDKFHSFIRNYKKDASILIEIGIDNVFLDISAFIAVRKYLQDLGYKICLDGVNYLSFSQIDRESLGFDLIKLQWNSDHKIDKNSKEDQALLKAIEKCGVNRIILCRCDNNFALEYGKNLGISIYQGWHFDELLKKN